MKLTTERNLKRDSLGKQLQRLIGKKTVLFQKLPPKNPTLQKMLKIETDEF